MYSRPSRLEINLDKLDNNVKSIRKTIPDGTEIIAIVKSNAYGMGDVEIVRYLKTMGISTFAVAATSEAIKIRREFEDVNIIILGYTPEYLYELIIRNNIIPTIYNYEMAIKLNEMAKSLNKKLPIQIKVDTGMNRIGFKTTIDSLNAIKKISKLDNIIIDGIFSHFANSEENELMTRKQYEEFKSFIDELEFENVNIGKRHINNTGGVLNFPEYSLDAVRPGIALYGTHDSDPKKAEDFGLKFIAELKTEVANVKMINSGEGVSYGSKFIAEKPTKIVTLPIGYSDGILRTMSGKIDVLIDGRRCRQVGTICMDQMMIDATGVDCKIGDEVVLIGKQKNEIISIDEYSKAAEEDNTPFLTHFSPRLCRVYLKDGKILKTIDEILI